ncbi:MAG: NAD+ synthase [Kiritimatiellae bacterium]|nr:NAD+ synthase [Kiritimatiellia bacterium]
MRKIPIALVQINTTVGALGENAKKIIEKAHIAHEAGASLIVFPELALSGYPPEDLLLKTHFIKDCEREIERLKNALPTHPIVIVGSPIRGQEKACNAAIIFHEGTGIAVYKKMVLPNYGVFDEKRVFEPGNKPLVIDIEKARIAIHICEDSWNTQEASVINLENSQIDLLINLSASPYHKGKRSLREKVLKQTASKLQIPIAYCNLVGGQDELVFDGASMALSPTGETIARGPQFKEDTIFTELVPSSETKLKQERFETVNVLFSSSSTSPTPSHRPIPVLDEYTEVYSALKIGLKDYVDKNGFKKVLVAISGGIDSALVSLLAVDALGADRVVGITMPSHYSSEATLSDARQLAQNLGIELYTMAIRDLYESYVAKLSSLWKGKEADSAEENLQARIRGTIVMALSNKFGWLVLTTGNKSELATGYCTLYGDMAGGFAVIKDVPKTLVFKLATWRNEQENKPIIPRSTIERPPSAELRPDQKDTDSLPPYDILDAILECYVEADMGMNEIIENGHDPQIVGQVIHLVDLNEYKRRQGPPGIKITPKAFGRDRRIPITNKYSE